MPKWLAPMFPMAEHENLTLELLSAGVGIVGILVAAYFYVMRPGAAEAFGKSMGGLYTFINNKYYVDELYHNSPSSDRLSSSHALFFGTALMRKRD